MTTFRSSLRQLCPPLLVTALRRAFVRPTYRGHYATWAEAKARARGYDDPAIFERVLQAARAVRDGRAAWERDAVLFQERSCHWPLLSALLRAAACSGGRLQLVDFGGAFGSTWWQHRAWLQGIPTEWSIVEQPAFVAAGRNEFGEPLRFHESLDACCTAGTPSVILLSSVLPYLEEPHQLLAEIARRRFPHVIIDRTGFMRDGRDRLVVQHVPPAIYPASYPCWFFGRERLLAGLGDAYRIVDEWPTFDRTNLRADFRGIYLERKP